MTNDRKPDGIDEKFDGIIERHRPALQALANEDAPLTREQLKALVPAREHESGGSWRYFRIAETPEPYRSDFEWALDGSTCPVIPGESALGTAYAHEWESWLSRRKHGLRGGP